jgi:hypothetical protein
LLVGLVVVETEFCETVTVDDDGVGADLGFPDPMVSVETVRTVVSFSGQNKIARIAIMSKMITIVGQCDFVNYHNDDACAVCGAFEVCVVGAVTTGVVAVAVTCAVGAVAVVGLVMATGWLGEVFTATGELGWAVATGADAGAEAVPAFATVFAIATRVVCIPFSVASTDASCDGVSVVFAASDVLSWPSVVARVPSVWLNALTWLAESPPVVCVAIPAPAPAPVPAIDGGMVLGVPGSAAGTTPASISRLASVAFATSSCCCSAAVWLGVSVWA